MTRTIRIWACILLGICIPLISFLLAHAGGDLLHQLQLEGWNSVEKLVLGVTCLVLCGSILSVSLSHVAESVMIISNSKRWQAWALAVTLDCALITMELARVLAYENWLSRSLMVLVVVWSAALNVFAFVGAVDRESVTAKPVLDPAPAPVASPRLSFRRSPAPTA